MKQFKTLLFGLFLAAASSLVAQDWTIYDMSNTPLPSSTITALEEDGVGGMWVGTDWGLCHFDGEAQWEVFQTADSGIPENYIRALALDTLGNIWVGFQTEGVAMWNGTDWTVYNTMNSGIAENEVRDLFVDHRNWIWIPTSSGLSVFTGSEWFLYNATDESHNGQTLATSSTNCVAVRSDGLVCMGSVNGGLHFLENDAVFYFNIPEHGFFDNTATDVLFDPMSGDRWIATPSAGLIRQQGPAMDGLWTQWAITTGFPADGISALSIDDQAQVWVATQGAGVVRMDPDGTWLQFTEDNSGLLDNETRSIEAGTMGDIWVGTTYGGLARYNGTVGMGESTNDLRSRVFPNPIHDGALTVQAMKYPKTWTWDLTDASGRSVRLGQESGTSTQVDTNELPKGMYLLKVHSGGFVESHRILVL